MAPMLAFFASRFRSFCSVSIVSITSSTSYFSRTSYDKSADAFIVDSGDGFDSPVSPSSFASTISSSSLSDMSSASSSTSSSSSASRSFFSSLFQCDFFFRLSVICLPNASSCPNSSISTILISDCDFLSSSTSFVALSNATRFLSSISFTSSYALITSSASVSKEVNSTVFSSRTFSHFSNCPLKSVFVFSAFFRAFSVDEISTFEPFRAFSVSFNCERSFWHFDFCFFNAGPPASRIFC
mmetsp:Transcript_5685/g.13797  ORF Transcript_5685/g.13797 Transcript_5685/m.13797 type:complete len:241 (-) Transcript_5685:2798-3520(-)